jgi:hypothetical protein
MPKTDLLNDLRPVSLTERLARFLGALELHARGLVSDHFLEAKIDQLKLGCRAADALLKVNTHHPEELEMVATKMHARLTS